MKLIHVIAAPGAADTIAAIADQQAVLALRTPVETFPAGPVAATESASADDLLGPNLGLSTARRALDAKRRGWAYSGP